MATDATTTNTATAPATPTTDAAPQKMHLHIGLPGKATDEQGRTWSFFDGNGQCLCALCGEPINSGWRTPGDIHGAAKPIEAAVCAYHIRAI